MSRVKTEHRIVNEGMTGRIIARRFLRRVLGNPKKREQDKADLCQELFFKGVAAGKKIENLRIQYSTAGMEYGAGYILEGINEELETTPGDGSVPDAVVAGVMLARPDARGADGVDADGGSDFA